MRGMAKVGGLGPSPRASGGGSFKSFTIFVGASGRIRIPAGAREVQLDMVQAGFDGVRNSQGGRGGVGGRLLRKTLRLKASHKTISISVGQTNGAHTTAQVNGEQLWSTANEVTESGGAGGLSGPDVGGGSGQSGGNTLDGAGAGGGGASSVQSSVYGGNGGYATKLNASGQSVDSGRGRGGGGGGQGAGSYPGNPGPPYGGQGGGPGSVPGGGGGGGYDYPVGTSYGPGLGARGEVKITFK